MKMCQAFQQEGYAPLLLAARHTRQVPDLPSLHHTYGITTPFPIEYLPIPWLRTTWAGYVSRHIFGLVAVLRARQRGARLIYTRDPRAGAWASKLGTPTIFESHVPERKGSVRFRLMVQGKGLRKIVVITHAVKDAYMQQFAGTLRPEQLIVEPDAVDLDQFATLPDVQTARLQMNLPLHSFVVGYTGNMFPGRGMELLLQLAQRIPEVLFLFVGGMDRDIQRYRSQAQAMGLENTRFVGFVPNVDLPGYLAACNALLMPYQRAVTLSSDGHGDTSIWMSPMKMFEYMAAGRLIISSDLPVLREILHEQNAVLCGPEDVDAWEQALRRAIQEPEWRERVGQQARREVALYTWRQRVRRIVAELPEPERKLLASCQQREEIDSSPGSP
jgi:glycosyltransferase involved in cell wall biosynthesis